MIREKISLDVLVEFAWGYKEQRLELKKLVSNQEISEREGAGLEILNWGVDILGWETKYSCVCWSGRMAFCENVSCN